MISRRTILQGAVAATSVPVVASVAWTLRQPETMQATPLDHPSLYKVLVDKRFATARAFGRDAEGRGLPVQAFNGDITDVWFNDLYPKWRQGRAAIAGLTTHSVLFCLEQLARDARMRVVQRTEHRIPGHETLYSWVIA